jgi:hypothetical protein
MLHWSYVSPDCFFMLHWSFVRPDYHVMLRGFTRFALFLLIYS